MNTDPQSVFVIMPFADAFTAGYTDIIEPSITQVGLTPLRADNDQLGHIHSRMFERIFESPIVIADISGSNPNVFYELGVVHSISKKTITVCRSDYLDQHVPFDIVPYRVIGYPKRPDNLGDAQEMKDYEDHSKASIDKITEALKFLLKPNSEGIDNPVQDYLASRSPLTCSSSLYLDEFSRREEEDMLKHIREEIIHVAISGTSFIGQMLGFVEAQRSSLPLKITLALLDMNHREAWKYLYHLREGLSPSEEDLDEYLNDEKSVRKRNLKYLERVQRNPHIKNDIALYPDMPLFWAYWIDRERLIVGHLAQNRISSRHLPVMVLLRDDPRTRSIYNYYTEIIEKMVGDK